VKPYIQFILPVQNAYNPKPRNNYLGGRFFITFLLDISFSMFVGSNFFHEFSVLPTGEVFLLRQVFVSECNPISLPDAEQSC